MKHYEYTKADGVRTFCFGDKGLSEALRAGASDVVDKGRVYFFRDRHGFPTWISEGMPPGVCGDLSEEGFQEINSVLLNEQGR
jgi:hypothetical protein